LHLNIRCWVGHRNHRLENGMKFSFLWHPTASSHFTTDAGCVNTDNTGDLRLAVPVFQLGLDLITLLQD
jgi:hypothetical protein